MKNIKQTKYFLSLILLFLILSPAFGEVNLYELVDNKKDAKVYPVGNYHESQIVSKCDSKSVKKRAMLFSSHNLQKKFDNDWKLGVVDATLKKTRQITGYDEQGRELYLEEISPTEYTNTAITVEEHKWERVSDAISNTGNLFGALGGFLFK